VHRTVRARSIANLFVLALALAVVWFMVAPLFLERQGDGAAGPAESGCSGDPAAGECG